MHRAPRYKQRLYRIWVGMRARCSNPRKGGFEYYGGRGIRVCKEWRDSYPAFEAWALANGYQEDLSIDRLDNDGDYEPGNCRWATRKQQARNRRNTKLKEKEIPLIRWLLSRGLPKSFIAKLFGVHRKTIWRVEHGIAWL